MAYKNNTVSVVIPNWNGKDLLKKNLPSVVAAIGEAELLIVDDGSTDDSLEFLDKEYATVTVVRKKKNDGFASAVNEGVKHAKGNIVVLLNTDIQPEKGFLDFLLPHFDNKEIFAVGCLEKSEEKGKIILRGRGIASWQKGFYIHRRGEVDKTDTAWVSGGSGAFRKSIWDKLGGMDRLYDPFYWEDIDLSYRARKSGYEILFEPKSIVVHRHEEGKIKLSFSPSKIQRIAYRNQFIFIWKNLSNNKIFLLHMFWLKVRLIQTVFNGNFNMFFGCLKAIILVPRILRNRQIQSHLWKLSDVELV